MGQYEALELMKEDMRWWTVQELADKLDRDRRNVYKYLDGLGKVGLVMSKYEDYRKSNKKLYKYRGWPE